MRKAEAILAVERIVDDLNDRAGLGLDDLDEETQQEIKETWVNILLEIAM